MSLASMQRKRRKKHGDRENNFISPSEMPLEQAFGYRAIKQEFRE